MLLAILRILPRGSFEFEDFLGVVDDDGRFFGRDVLEDDAFGVVDNEADLVGESKPSLLIFFGLSLSVSFVFIFSENNTENKVDK